MENSQVGQNVPGVQPLLPGIPSDIAAKMEQMRLSHPGAGIMAGMGMPGTMPFPSGPMHMGQAFPQSKLPAAPGHDEFMEAMRKRMLEETSNPPAVVQIKMLDGKGLDSEFLPQKAHDDDAAYDVRSTAAVDLQPMVPAIVPTGFQMALGVGYEAQIRPRSGLAAKHGIIVANAPGTIDEGFRGEVGVILMNTGKAVYPIKVGDRIAQMVINKLPKVDLVCVEELPVSKRGAGGFGSTGVK